ncbi:uncharacterized protein B0H18DRAFT_1008555, partial [Fomitopsis serialis]|uniref:uncharacterized protein n=1 Tax=Fomitopsis serialis TaxID=139415 RepID=UPI002007F8F9
MVLVLTWWQLYGALRISRQGHSRSALAILLLRDNTSYFVLFLLINVIQMITSFVLDNDFNPIPTFMFPLVHSDSRKCVDSQMSNSFTCIVISRLILNLRRLSSAMRSPMHARS